MKIYMLHTKARIEKKGISCTLRLGEKAGKHDSFLIPITSDTPMECFFNVFKDGETDLAFGVAAKDDAEFWKEAKIFPDMAGIRPGGINLRTQPTHAPKDSEFQVVKASEEYIIIRAGEDHSPRILLFVGQYMKRGEVSLYTRLHLPTGRILASCQAKNEAEARCDAAVILEDGQCVAFRVVSEEYDLDELYIYAWKGGKITQEQFTRVDWEGLRDVEDRAKTAEVL